MLSAYYSCGCDSAQLFSGLNIADAEDFEEHLNRYHVIFLNMQEFLSQSGNMEQMISLIRRTVLWELLEEYPDFRYFDSENLMRTMQDVYRFTVLMNGTAFSESTEKTTKPRRTIWISCGIC